MSLIGDFAKKISINNIASAAGKVYNFVQAGKAAASQAPPPVPTVIEAPRAPGSLPSSTWTWVALAGGAILLVLLVGAVGATRKA